MKKIVLVFCFTFCFVLSGFAQDKLPRGPIGKDVEIFIGSLTVKLGQVFNNTPAMKIRNTHKEDKDWITHMGVYASTDTMKTFLVETLKSKVFLIDVFLVDKNNIERNKLNVQGLLEKYKKYKTSYKKEGDLNRYYFEDDQTKMQIRYLDSYESFVYTLTAKGVKIPEMYRFD